MKALHTSNVFLEGIVLKPSMVLPGPANEDRKKIAAKEVAEYTL
jgi:fructose-bisphosphate aldolase class 1